jgi:hypothetical protein
MCRVLVTINQEYPCKGAPQGSSLPPSFRAAGYKSMCIRKVLPWTQILMIFLCLEPNIEMVEQFYVATACFSYSPPDYIHHN